MLVSPPESLHGDQSSDLADEISLLKSIAETCGSVLLKVDLEACEAAIFSRGKTSLMTCERPDLVPAPGLEDFCQKKPDPTFWPGGTGGVGLSGRRGEIGNHKVAGKIGVMTMAALPATMLTPSSQALGGVFRCCPCCKGAQGRTVNLSNKSVVEGIFFRTSASADCSPSWRCLKARCPADSGCSRTATGHAVLAERFGVLPTDGRRPGRDLSNCRRNKERHSGRRC
jgi:hypothetical protein